MSSPFAIDVRVYFEDTDVTGVVYHANYLRYFERARSDWLRDAGVQQEDLRGQHNCCFAVADCDVQYRQPARLDDLLTVTAAVKHLGRASIEFDQQVLRGDTVLATGRFRIASLDAANFRPGRLPEFVRQAAKRAAQA